MDLPLQSLEGVVRERLRRGLKPRGYRDFDRRIGKRDSGWTSKFLRGERPLTLETLLVVLVDLDIHPADLFEEAFPRPEASSTDDALIKLFRESLESGPAGSFIEQVVKKRVAEELESLRERLRQLEESRAK